MVKLVMPDYKTIFSILAVVLTFVGYAPYLLDTIKNKTKPHLFSWFIWGVTDSIIYKLQVNAGAGAGSWTTLAVVLLLFCVFILGFKNGNKNIKKIDVVFLVLALSAIPLWLVVKQPILSVLLLCVIDIIAFIPTIRKSWNDPYSETLSLYTITTFRFALTFFALSEYNIITWLFPVTWFFANALFSVVLIIRRRKFEKKL